MKLKIYLRPEAHKHVAKGDQLWSWHFFTTPDSEYEGTAKPDHTFLAEVEVELPNPEAAVHIALAELKKREHEVNLQAAEQLSEIAETRAKLLSLTYNDIPTKDFEDVPF